MGRKKLDEYQEVRELVKNVDVANKDAAKQELRDITMIQCEAEEIMNRTRKIMSQ